MKKLTLVHRFTPSSLIPVSKEIETMLSQEEWDEEALLRMINQRDELLRSFLAKSDIPPPELKSFLEHEILANDLLVRVTSNKLTTTQKQLIKLVRGRKAFQKYT